MQNFVGIQFTRGLIDMSNIFKRLITFMVNISGIHISRTVAFYQSKRKTPKTSPEMFI